jgi:hypothetical protein
MHMVGHADVGVCVIRLQLTLGGWQCAVIAL